jgi:hypothetical protein
MATLIRRHPILTRHAHCHILKPQHDTLTVKNCVGASYRMLLPIDQASGTTTMASRDILTEFRLVRDIGQPDKDAQQGPHEQPKGEMPRNVFPNVHHASDGAYVGIEPPPQHVQKFIPRKRTTIPELLSQLLPSTIGTIKHCTIRYLYG